ncbi:uncharacterized protein LOC126895283 isoform X2 [Daktulosphaira vitifoliae]|uniref:uncharacterized protein LOC126895283 isoform X2 n=1 Tax=Daktulosphaira vitifoliae TaxID=58002 RepID=UPI0021A9CD0E|nr:uncharacterized protein LOC126895283 isoform X2 [Daktulosphaira vitifoliae]
MFLFTYSFFIALYILETSSSFQNDESGSYQVQSQSDDGTIIDDPLLSQFKNHMDSHINSLLSAYKKQMEINTDSLLCAYKGHMDNNTASLLSAYKDFTEKSKIQINTNTDPLLSTYKIFKWDKLNNIKTIKDFNPVDWEWQLNKASLLKINSKYIVNCVKNIRTNEKLNGSNLDLNIIYIERDMHYFVKAISYWITGSVVFYQRIKSQLVKFLKQSENYLDYEFNKENIVLKRSDPSIYNVISVGVAELYAAAEMLKTSIYVFANEKWFFISKDGINGKITDEQCLYLENPYENHFNVIVHG